MSEERNSGYPQPHLYDQHYINKYAYPKGLKCIGRRSDWLVTTESAINIPKKDKKSLYDMKAPHNRKGFSGWKLTKKPQDSFVEYGT